MPVRLIPYDAMGRGYACSICRTHYFARINADTCCSEKRLESLQEVIEVDFSE